MKLEREVAQIWEQEAKELQQHAADLNERANRKEAESIATLSLDEAALAIVQRRKKPPTFFDLFNVLKWKQAAQVNVVQFYYAMRRSPLVRMNGIAVVRRKPLQEQEAKQP